MSDVVVDDKVGEDAIGPWVTNRPWGKVAGKIQVPRNARTVLIRIELTGSTGWLDVDEVELHTTPR